MFARYFAWGWRETVTHAGVYVISAFNFFFQFLFSVFSFCLWPHAMSLQEVKYEAAKEVKRNTYVIFFSAPCRVSIYIHTYGFYISILFGIYVIVVVRG